MIRRADLGICNLTPFRGPGADAGTVFELGLMIGLGKRVFAYTNERADYIDRVRASRAITRDAASEVWRDGDGLMVEDFGNADNLMLDCGLRQHGGGAILRPEGRIADPLHDLTMFEACLRRAAEALGKTA